MFYNWGKVVGNMHRFTRDYTPGDGMEKRHEFSIRSMISENIKDFPAVNKIAENLLKEIENLPKDKDSYGLIHNDLHPGNFLIDGEHIHLIDFDGCMYSISEMHCILCYGWDGIMMRESILQTR